jgi:DNA-binding transcriptional MerR regulator
MRKAEVTEFIRRASEKGIPFEEIDRFLLAEVPNLTVSELAKAYREAAKSYEAEADELENFSRPN